MTRSQLEAVINAIAECVDSWNNAATSEDRGRSNHAFCLTVYEDGSGKIGQRGFSGVADHYDFDDLDGLVDVLAHEGITVEADDART